MSPLAIESAGFAPPFPMQPPIYILQQETAKRLHLCFRQPLLFVKRETELKKKEKIGNFRKFELAVR